MQALTRLSKRFFSVRIFSNSIDAVEDVITGSRIAVGGYGACGVPENSLRALRELGSYDLTMFTCTAGMPGYGIDLNLQAKQVKRLVTSYIGDNPSFHQQYVDGEVELMLVPEGSLAARIYAGGAGIPAFYTETGVGTVVEDGHFPVKYYPKGRGVEIYSAAKEKRRFKNRNLILESGITTDFSFVKAWKGDTKGNLVFKKTAANFNPVMATCSRVTIAEVEEIVPEGEIDPDVVDTPAVYVDRIFKGEYFEKPIERLVYNTSKNKIDQEHISMFDKKLVIAKRAALELDEGDYVHLGYGIASLVAHFQDPDTEVVFHSEPGILGVGRYPTPGEESPDIINSARETVTLRPGGATFDSNVSMDMLRAGHLDTIIIGAHQISQKGDIANWMVPGNITVGIGAAMDAAVGERSKVIVTSLHNYQSMPKIVRDCSYPITAKECCDLLITELGVFDFTRESILTLVEIAPKVRLSEIKERTGCSFHVASDLKTMKT